MAPAHSKLIGSGAVDLRKSAENVEKCFVGTSSRLTYNHKLLMFTVWLFDFRKKHLVESAVMRMKKMVKLDVEDREQREQRRRRGWGDDSGKQSKKAEEGACDFGNGHNQI